MNQMFRQNLVEAVIGFVVLVVAVVAVLFFYQRTSASDLGEHYTVSALFQNAAGVNVGTDVRVSGVTVGSVRVNVWHAAVPDSETSALALEDPVSHVQFARRK